LTGIRRKHWVAIIAGTIVLVASGAALALTGAEESGQTVQIALGEVTLEDDMLLASVSLSNADSTQHEVDVWLTLGLFGAGEAWDRRVSELETRSVALRSGEAAAVHWDEAVAAPSGWYEVTAWVRLDGEGGQVMQLTAENGIEVTAEDVLSRVHPASSERRLNAPDLTMIGGEFGYLRGSISATAGSDATSAKIDLLAEDARTPWWSRTAESTFHAQMADGADGISAAPVDRMIALRPGDYTVRIQLWSGEELLDQVLLPDHIEVSPADSSVLREALPVGPVAIVAIEASPDWSGAERHVVTVDLQNLSSESITASVWWYLAAPGDPAPWEFPEARSFEISRDLDPFERRSVRLAIDGPPPTGRGFELSAWTHVVPESGDSVHSDGVRHTQSIDAVSASQEGA
jgi:hypothetical protein